MSERLPVPPEVSARIGKDAFEFGAWVGFRGAETPAEVEALVKQEIADRGLVVLHDEHYFNPADPSNELGTLYYAIGGTK